jgi:uncharacterized protein
MHPHITVLTLAVDDLERAVAFYRDGLGLATRGVVGSEIEDGAVAFFPLTAGLTLALWPRESLARDSGVPVGGAGGATMSIGHNVGSPAEVDEILRQAESGGAQIVKPGKETAWGGYAGYFRDPDGHLWDVVFNPDPAALGR